MKDKISCSVVRDLLVGYMDETCSDESRKIIEEHLSECRECSDELRKYSADIPVGTENEKKSENLKAAKPFRKIKKRIAALIVVLCIIVAAAVPVAAYCIKYDKSGGYEADKLFLGVSDEDILYSNDQLISNIKVSGQQLYRSMYYKLKSKRGESNYEQDAAALTEEFNMVNNVKFDFENAEISFEEIFNFLTISIPVITPWDEQKSTLQVYGSWYAPGHYLFGTIQLQYENFSAYGYSNTEFIVLPGDMIEACPFSESMDNMTVNALHNGHSKKIDQKDQSNYNDSGYRFKSGIYKYENEEGRVELLVFYDDGTVFFRSNDTESLITIMKNTLRPSKYAVFEAENGSAENPSVVYRIFFWGESSVVSFGLVLPSEITDSEIKLNGKNYELISENTPDEKELEKMINDMGLFGAKE